MSEGVGSGYQGLVEVKKALSHKRHGRCLGQRRPRMAMWGCKGNMDLVDVRDEPAFTWCVDLLIVGPQLALDGEEQHLQVPFLCESEAETKSR